MPIHTDLWYPYFVPAVGIQKYTLVLWSNPDHMGVLGLLNVPSAVFPYCARGWQPYYTCMRGLPLMMLHDKPM